MLNFIQGRPGSGKTTFLIGQKIKSHLMAGRKVEMLVPKQITFTTEEKILCLLGPRMAGDVDVFSFRRLAENLFINSKQNNKTPILSGVSSIIMAGLITSMKDKFLYYNKKIDNNLILELLDQVRMFKTCNVSVDNLKELRDLVSGNLQNKINDLILIYEAYIGSISTKYYDENDILTEIINIVIKEGYFKGKVIAIDGFTYMTMQEMRIIALAVEQAEEVYVTISSDNFRSHDKASVFAHANSCARDLLSVVKSSNSSAEENIIDMKEINSSFNCRTNEELRLIEDNLYKDDIESDIEVSNVKIYSGINPDDECDFVAREIKKLIRSGEYRPRDITVAFRSFGEYKGRLLNSFKKYDIPAFEDKRQPIRNTPLIVYITSLLKLAADSRYDTEDILRYIKSGLSPLEEADITEIENYAYIWNINYNGWTKPFTKNPDGFGLAFNEKSTKKLEQIENIRLSFMPQIVDFVESLKNKTAKEICSSIYSFLKKNKIDYALLSYAQQLEDSGDLELALEQNDVWDMLMKILDEMVIALNDKNVTPKEFYEYFDLIIDTKSFGKVPNHFDEVMVSSFDRLLNHMPKVLFSVGCNSGVFPNYDLEKGLFSNFERNTILEADLDFKIVDSDLDAIDYERFLVYLALTTASEKLYVTCSETDFEAKAIEPSEIFDMLGRILKNINFIPYDNSVMNVVLSKESAFEQFVQKVRSGGVEAASLKKYFENDESKQKQLKAIDAVIKNEKFKIKDLEIAKNLFGRTMTFSATSMGKYEECPFSYYCDKGLNLRKIEKAEFKNNHLGSAIHEVLERLIANHPKEYFLMDNLRELLLEADTVLKSYLEEKMGGEEDKDARFLYVYYRAKKTLKDALVMLIAELNDTDFIPQKFELKIGGNEVDKYRLELDEGYIELTGSIDRVDAFNKGGNTYIKIVDYKTGHKEFSLSKAIQGHNIQMILYLIAVLENRKKIFENDVKPAAIIYTLIQRISKPNNKGAKIHEGMVLDDDDIINSLYISNKDKADKLINVDITKNKFTEDDFNLIANRIKSLIIDMGNKVHSGEIAPYPALGKDIDACKYCPYDSICRKSNGVEHHRIKEMKFDEAINILREEDENSGN